MPDAGRMRHQQCGAVRWSAACGRQGYQLTFRHVLVLAARSRGSDGRRQAATHTLHALCCCCAGPAFFQPSNQPSIKNAAEKRGQLAATELATVAVLCTLCPHSHPHLTAQLLLRIRQPGWPLPASFDCSAARHRSTDRSPLAKSALQQAPRQRQARDRVRTVRRLTRRQRA